MKAEKPTWFYELKPAEIRGLLRFVKTAGFSWKKTTEILAAIAAKPEQEQEVLMEQLRAAKRAGKSSVAICREVFAGMA